MEQQLALIEIKAGARTERVISGKQMQRRKVRRPFTKPAKPLPPGAEQSVSILHDPLRTAVEGQHQKIGRGRCFEEIQAALDRIRIDEAAVQMKIRGLRKPDQRLVSALHRQIRSAPDRAVRKSAVPHQSEMRAVRLIHTKRHAAAVADGGKTGYVTQNALIGRARDHDAACRRPAHKQLLHILRPDTAPDPGGRLV